jgi:hypothetical protein
MNYTFPLLFGVASAIPLFGGQMKMHKLAGIVLVMSVLLVIVFVATFDPASADVGGPDNGVWISKANSLLDAEDLSQDKSINDDTATTATGSLCRLGYAGATLPLADYPAGLPESLRGGWLLNWSTGTWNYTVNDMRYAPSIFVKQWKWDNGLVLYDWDAPYAVPYTYTVSPSISDLKTRVANHLGQLWLVGNEIERRDWTYGDKTGSLGQGEILPEVYAVAYHEIYHAIKEVDPTARVANGSVILPSPLRIEYLTRMWDEYYRLYGMPMPVDVWQTHLYLIQERAGELESGAGIPAGIDAQTGLFANLTDVEKTLINKDFSYVPGLIRDFRQWMKDRGQQDKPMIITEMAVMMPDWIMPGAFTPEAIANEFLYKAIDYIFTERDVNLGYPEDDYRLVQSMWWWSFDKDFGNYVDGVFLQSFNGNLAWTGLESPPHAPMPRSLSKLGTFWAAKVATIADEANLVPIRYLPGAATSFAGEPVDVDVKIQIINSGNVAVTTPFTVRLYREGTSTILGEAVVYDRLEGCGEDLWLVFPDTNLSPGVHTIRAVVDVNNQVPEVNNNDNSLIFTILVSGQGLRLPFIVRQ